MSGDLIVPATEVVKGDTILLDVGWRNVLDVWESLGFIHVVASDATGLFYRRETVVLARRPRPPRQPRLEVVKP